MTAQAWSLTDLENKMLFQMVLSHSKGGNEGIEEGGVAYKVTMSRAL